MERNVVADSLPTVLMAMSGLCPGPGPFLVPLNTHLEADRSDAVRTCFSQCNQAGNTVTGSSLHVPVLRCG